MEKAQALQLEKTRRRAWETVRRYGLIRDGDKILVGLSGGKDSLALAEILGARMRISRPSFTLVAAHVVVENIPYQSDIPFLESHCAAYGIPLVVARTSFDASSDRRKTPCFLCSWNRRKTLFDVAKGHGCNKIALGHHEDDIVETLLMNLFFQGSFGTMPPLMQMDKFDMQIIRPLARNTEAELRAYADIRRYPPQRKNCPHEHASVRANIKAEIARIETFAPDLRRSVWHAMENLRADYLPKIKPNE